MEALPVNDLALVGVNHHNANVTVREKLSIPQDQVSGFLSILRERELTRESLVLSTCNRIELYCLSSRPDLILAEMVARGGRHLEELQQLCYIKRGRQTIRHAFEVASGLDSMILGEPEILGQMKNALRAARTEHFTGNALGQLFERAFQVAKKVRTETAINREAISAPAICAKLAQRIFGDLNQCNVLCIGAGTIIETALAYFANHCKQLTVANRTLHHARKLATRFHADVLPYEEVLEQLHAYDIVLTATSSVLPVLGKGAFERALRLRVRKPMAVFDLAVPRDVELEADELEDLFLHTIDDIGQVAGVNLAKRRAAADEAREHIDTATADMLTWFAQRDAINVIKDLRERLDGVRDTELHRAQTALTNGVEPTTVLLTLARRLTNRLAHDPLQALRVQHANRDIIDELSNWYSHDNTDNGNDKPAA